MAGLNKVILMGNLVAKPQLNTSPSDVKWTKFRIGVARKNKDNAGNTLSDFFTCVSFGKCAEFICNYFDKGNSIIVIGEIHTNTYTDESGVKRNTIQIEVNEATFGSGKVQSGNDSSNEGTSIANESGANFEEINTEEDVPF